MPKDLVNLFFTSTRARGGSCEPKNRKVGFPFAREHFGTDCEGQARIRIHEEKPDFSVHFLGIRPLQRKWGLILSHLLRERKSRESKAITAFMFAELSSLLRTAT